MDLQRKIRAWLPLRKRPESLQIPSSLNSYFQQALTAALYSSTE